MSAEAASRAESIAQHFRSSRETLERASADRALLDAMLAIADTMIKALKGGGKCGQHGPKTLQA